MPPHTFGCVCVCVSCKRVLAARWKLRERRGEERVERVERGKRKEEKRLVM